MNIWSSHGFAVEEKKIHKHKWLIHENMTICKCWTQKNSIIFKYVTVRETFAQVHWRYVKHHRRSWPGELLSCPVLYNVLMRGHRELCIFVECSLIIVCLILICCRTPPLSVLSARFMWVGHLRLERNTRTLKNINS